MGIGWQEEMHPRGYHGRWVYAGGRKYRWSDFERRVHEGLNTRGHEIMRGFGSTERLHGGPNAYSPARQDVHADIIRSELRGHRGRREHPQALFTSGGAASGKSWLTRNRAPKDAVVSDADRVKTGVPGLHDGLPEYHRLKMSGNEEAAAPAVHEESSHVAKQVAAAAIARRQNLVVDGVGDSAPEKFADKVRAAQRAGYSVSVEHMHMSMQDAKRIEALRAQKTGRKVDPGAFEAGHKGSARNMAEIAKIPGVHVVIWSNTGGLASRTDGEPVGRRVKVAEGTGSARGLDGLRVLNPAEWRSFKAKAGVH